MAEDENPHPRVIPEIRQPAELAESAVSTDVVAVCCPECVYAERVTGECPAHGVFGLCPEDGILYEEPEDEVEVDIVHLMTEEGCKISINGQGHLPCSEHVKPEDGDG